jgi:hypothetical protein
MTVILPLLVLALTIIYFFEVVLEPGRAPAPGSDTQTAAPRRWSRLEFFGAFLPFFLSAIGFVRLLARPGEGLLLLAAAGLSLVASRIVAGRRPAARC